MILTLGRRHVILLHASHVHLELTLVVEHVVSRVAILNAVISAT